MLLLIFSFIFIPRRIHKTHREFCVSASDYITFRREIKIAPWSFELLVRKAQIYYTEEVPHREQSWKIFTRVLAKSWHECSILYVLLCSLKFFFFNTQKQTYVHVKGYIIMIYDWTSKEMLSKSIFCIIFFQEWQIMFFLYIYLIQFGNSYLVMNEPKQNGGGTFL